MKFNIFFTIKDQNNTVFNVPNVNNPVECDLDDLLDDLKDNLPESEYLGTKVIGIRIELAKEE